MDQKLNSEAFLAFMLKHGADLQQLGFFFLQLLRADLHVSSPQPSPTFAAAAVAHPLLDVPTLCRELEEAGVPLLDDGSGGSILRL